MVGKAEITSRDSKVYRNGKMWVDSRQDILDVAIRSQ